MATATAPRGSALVSCWKQETNFGIPPSGNWTRLPIYGDTIKASQPWQDDQLLGLSLNNLRDASDPAPGLPSAGGQVEFPLDLAYAGFPLNMVMGAPTTSGTTPNYTHVFNSGAEAIPHWSRENRLNSAGTLFNVATGLIGKKFGVDIGRKEGFDRITVDFLGKTAIKGTSTVAGTPLAMPTRVPLPAVLPVFKFNSTLVADVLSLSLSYDNGVVENDALGDANGYPLGHDADDQTSCTGTIKVRLRGTGMWDQAANLPTTLSSGLGEVLWQVNTNRSLLLSMAQMWLEPADDQIKGKGRIEQSFAFRCSQNASTPMLVATLKSPTATFP